MADAGTGRAVSRRRVLAAKAAESDPGAIDRLVMREIVEHEYTGSLAALWAERLERGRDYGRTRIEHERWGRGHAAAYLAAFPLLLLTVIARTAREAFAAGWEARFVATFPVQSAGHAAWLAGEARACGDRLVA